MLTFLNAGVISNAGINQCNSIRFPIIDGKSPNTFTAYNNGDSAGNLYVFIEELGVYLTQITSREVSQVNDIVSIISTVGFPIALTLILLWYIYDSNNKHKEEIDKMSEALNNNTLALTKLLDRMESDKIV